MPETTRGYPYPPETGVSPNIPQALKSLAEAVDADFSGVAGTLSLEQAKNMEDRLTLVEGRVAVAENVKIKRYNFQVWDGHPNTFDTGVPRERRIIYGIERLTPSVNMGSVIGGFSISMDGKGVLTISASGTNGGRFTFSGSAFVVYRE